VRIVLINQFYKPDTAATGQLLADVAEELAAKGHEVHVICGRTMYGGGRLPAPREQVVNGIHIHRVACTSFGRHRLIGRAMDYLSFYLTAARRALKLPRPDVCVSLTTPPLISLVGLMLSKLKGTQSVIWVMDVYPDVAVAYDVLQKRTLLYRVLTRVNRVLYRNAAAVISLGEVMTQRLQSLGAGPDNIHTVHNWVPGETVGRLDGVTVGRFS
jgi:UDP-N-acetylglucosamine:LPS N-acetylglucosamine transferase